MRNSFPSRYAPRGVAKPITGPLDSIALSDEQHETVERLVIGLFLDMQNQPLARILMACYISGFQHALAATDESDLTP